MNYFTYVNLQLNYINIVKRCLSYHLKDGTMLDGQSLRVSFEKAIDPLQERPSFLFLAPSLLINLNEIKITCLCQSTIQKWYVGFILKSGFTKH